MAEKPKPKRRNRAAEARDKGKRLVMFEISLEFDDLIEQVRDQVEGDLGSCSRVQALEKMGREGAKRILKKA